MLAFFLGSCASSGRPDADPVVGCYQFEWTREAGELGLPWGFELRPDSLTGWAGYEDARVAVTRATATRVADHPINYWRRMDSGIIQIGYTGLGSVSLGLRPEGQNLVGQGVPVGDAVRMNEPPDRTPRPVTAFRVLCPPVGTPEPETP